MTKSELKALQLLSAELSALQIVEEGLKSTLRSLTTQIEDAEKRLSLALHSAQTLLATLEERPKPNPLRNLPTDGLAVEVKMEEENRG